MITRERVLADINVKDSGWIELRYLDIIAENGVELARSYHRDTIAPGSDVSGHSDRVQAVAKAAWAGKEE